MAWFFKLLADNNASTVVTLADGADLEDLQRQLSEAAPDSVVRIPARMNDQMRESPLYVRPSRWAAWQFFHHDAEQVE